MFDLFTVFAMRGNSILGFFFMSTNAGDLELAFNVVLRLVILSMDLPSNVWLFSMFFSLFVLFFPLVLCFGGIQDSMSCF